MVGTPAEISLIRMTADGRLPPEQRRGYKNVFNALFRITREEGVMTLWRVRHCLSVCMHECLCDMDVHMRLLGGVVYSYEYYFIN